MTKRFFGVGGGRSSAAFSLLFFGLVGSVTLSGCGGHHSSSSSSNTTLTAIIDWPERTRSISGVSSAAVACIITVESGDPSTGDPIDFPPIIRSAVQPSNVSAGTAFSSSWKSPSQVAPGMRKIQVRFYSTLPTGTTSGVDNDMIPLMYKNLPSVGDITPTDEINITGDTTDLGTFAVTGTIASLAVPATLIPFGDTTTLTASALDATGKIAIALTGGSAFYSAPTGATITTDAAGDAKAVGLGATTVTATVTGGVTGDVSTTAAVTAIVGAGELSSTDASIIRLRDTITGSTSGVAAADGQTVSVTYAGYYSADPANIDSGTYMAFDTTYATTARTLTLGGDGVPAGLSAAISGMLPGGTRIVVIPAAQTGGLGLPSSAPAGSPAIYIIQRAN